MLKAENKFEFYKDVPGITKVAILLLALDQEASGAILRQLRPTAVEEVVRELADTGFIPQDIRDRVLEEFYELAMSQNWASEGGLGFAKTLLEQALPPGTWSGHKGIADLSEPFPRWGNCPGCHNWKRKRHKEND